jgi:WD repeat-containing protein 7
MLSYSDGRVRLWNVKTREFWRSTAVDKAEELLHQGGWVEA